MLLDGSALVQSVSRKGLINEQTVSYLYVMDGDIELYLFHPLPNLWTGISTSVR